MRALLITSLAFSLLYIFGFKSNEVTPKENKITNATSRAPASSSSTYNCTGCGNYEPAEVNPLPISGVLTLASIEAQKFLTSHAAQETYKRSVQVLGDSPKAIKLSEWIGLYTVFNSSKEFGSTIKGVRNDFSQIDAAAEYLTEAFDKFTELDGVAIGAINNLIKQIDIPDEEKIEFHIATSTKRIEFKEGKMNRWGFKIINKIRAVSRLNYTKEQAFRLFNQAADANDHSHEALDRVNTAFFISFPQYEVELMDHQHYTKPFEDSYYEEGRHLEWLSK